MIYRPRPIEFIKLVPCALGMILSASAVADIQFIDFETRGSGTAWTYPVDNFIRLQTQEYLPQGVTITADLGNISPGRAKHFLGGENIGTSSIRGYHISHGASAGVDTFLDFRFSPRVNNISFDWASSTSGQSVVVSLFDSSDTLIQSISDPSDQTYIIQGNSFVYRAGHFAIDLPQVEVARMRVNDHPVGNHGIEIDNLRFNQISSVPEPSSALLLVIGLAANATARSSREKCRREPEA